VPQWLARATDKLPSQAAARIGHGDAGLANPGDPPPRSRAPATYRRRSRARIVSAVRS